MRAVCATWLQVEVIQREIETRERRRGGKKRGGDEERGEEGRGEERRKWEERDTAHPSLGVHPSLESVCAVITVSNRWDDAWEECAGVFVCV